AEAVLVALGAVDAAGSITDRGRLIAEVGVDPRLARALLDGAAQVGAERAAEVVAMLEQDIAAPGADLSALLRALRSGGGPGAAEWNRQRRRLREARLRPAMPGPGRDERPEPTMELDLAVGTITALAPPDRIPRLRPGGSPV